VQFFRNEELKQELNDVGSLTEERLDELLDMFLNDFEAGKVDARGWPAAFAAYKVAKAAMNSYSRILAARQLALRVNCVHPGYIKTDLTAHSGLLTPEEGGRRVVQVALLPEGGVTGALSCTDTDTRIGIGKIRIRGYANFPKKPRYADTFNIFKK